jgi:purine-binding chemotaxis protein CheW
VKRKPATEKQAASIDWSAIQRRLETAQAALEQGLTPTTPEEQKRILKARASALAHAPKGEDTTTARIEVVEFLLAYERYGLELPYVREVYPLKELTSLPCTPPFVVGIINVRGRLLSVLDIKNFFDLPAKGLTDLNKVIIVHDPSMEFGILADALLGVRSIPIEEIQASLPTLTGIREEYLKGVTKDRLVILDAGRLLSDKKIIVHEEVD